jgi:SAM-dependent methyltransferase
VDAGHYRSLAADYHWFFDDVDLFLGCDTPGVRAAMAGLASGARVLDAACGIGVDAAAPLRRGFDVAASDASDEMAAVARHHLRSLGADGARCLRTYSWHIPERFGDPHVLEIAPIFLEGDRCTVIARRPTVHQVGSDV